MYYFKAWHGKSRANLTRSELHKISSLERKPFKVADLFNGFLT